MKIFYPYKCDLVQLNSLIQILISLRKFRIFQVTYFRSLIQNPSLRQLWYPHLPISTSLFSSQEEEGLPSLSFPLYPKVLPSLPRFPLGQGARVPVWSRVELARPVSSKIHQVAVSRGCTVSRALCPHTDK